MPTDPATSAGACTSRLSRPVIMIAVDDIDATLEKVRERRRAVGEKVVVAEMGIAAYFEDSEGNLTGLWQNAS